MYDLRKNGRGYTNTMYHEPEVLTEGSTWGEYGLSPNQIFGVIRRRWWVIVLTVIVLVGGALGLSYSQTPIYQASIKIIVGQELDPDAPGNRAGDVTGLQQFTRTAAQVVNTRPVAEEVIRELDLSTTPEVLLANLTVEQVNETQVIEVSYQDPDPQRAKQVADTVGEVFSRQISELTPNTQYITATLWERALLPGSPVSPQPLRNSLLALVLGAILGVGLALLLEYFDDSWRSSEEVEQISGLPTLGVIPRFQRPKGGKKSGDEVRKRERIK